MGLYFGKVRANGSDIRGFKGAAGGVIRWIKLVNDTATAVDQLGVRQGAVAVYLDAWQDVYKRQDMDSKRYELCSLQCIRRTHLKTIR